MDIYRIKTEAHKKGVTIFWSADKGNLLVEMRKMNALIRRIHRKLHTLLDQRNISNDFYQR